MKVVLVAVHQLSGYSVELQRCLGVLVLASALRENGIECEVLDFTKLSLFEEGNRELVLKEAIDIIAAARPDVLGLSSMSNNLVIAIDICRQVKRHNPKIHTIIGGPGASSPARDILMTFPDVDAIIRGEADVALLEYVKELQILNFSPMIKGLVHRNSDTIIDNGWPEPIEDLDTTPIPFYELCKRNNGTNPVTMHLEVGRGCPYGCVFCSTSVYFRRKYRVKSVERVLHELSEIRSHFGDAIVIFNHDLLTHDRNYTIRLCEALEKLDPQIEWGASVRFDTIDPEILSIMNRAGCKNLFLGIEAATQRLQQIINKKLNLEILDTALECLVELEFNFTVAFIVGFPEETDADMRSLWRLAFKIKQRARNNVIIQIHSLSPEPGSKIFDEWKSKLHYDDYGSPGHSDFPPLAWKRIRHIIKKYPVIFPIYNHIELPPERRISSLKHSFLGRAFQGFTTHSMIQAYKLLGEPFLESLVDRLDELELPPPEGETLRYLGLMRSLRIMILDLLEGNNLPTDKYDTIAQTELALLEVIGRKDESFSRVVYTKYDPIRLMNILEGKQEEVELEERFRYTNFFWSQELDTVKTAEIPESLAMILMS
ncbi:MAG: B12-binding domain-containing radical SAM protein [Candidatus Thorarchaeota archaeon]